jgi:phosphatidylserine decarboxylase
MRIAREGYPLIFTAALLSLLAFAAGWLPLGSILAFVTLAITAFFRDPERHPPEGEGLIIAPADGKVVNVANVRKDESRFSGAAVRVSIFLSPLDVHINRSPVEGKVEEVRYERGKFLAAYKDQSSAGNEQNSLSIVEPNGRRVGVVQVAGVVARRIVCRVKQGDHLPRGARFGLIMFGSRTDTYLPEGCRVDVVEGQRVKGGETILGRFV